MECLILDPVELYVNYIRLINNPPSINVVCLDLDMRS